ncbi:MAG: mannose-1-phosphate guanylyltransferase/mannose-6-phosphate isomerase [Pseudohongiellaceae bacterium]
MSEIKPSLGFSASSSATLIPVVISGGVGSRLWPVSRALLPKQYIEIPGMVGSLFQNTLERVKGLDGVAEPIVVCSEEHRFVVAEQLRQIDVGAQLLLEPYGRNTAPAIALAAMEAMALGEDPLLLVLPADHLIEDTASLHRAIGIARTLAMSSRLVTFGIPPRSPETGYGYLQQGDEIAGGGVDVVKFVEKPDLATAQRYVDEGDYLWNSGMFLFRASVFLKQLKIHATDIHETCTATHAALERETDFARIPDAEFHRCRSDSIDYAVMEKAGGVAAVPLNAGWNDLGAWDALWSVQVKDGDDNVVSGDVLTEEVYGSYIQSESRLVAAVGVRDAIIIETPDAVLVANREDAQGVKKIVDQLQALGRSERLAHRRERRPWGSFESLASGQGFQVKRIVVNPRSSLSLQSHQHRAEHWVMLAGVGRVECDEKVIDLQPNESTFIPKGSKHRLSNLGDAPIELIEVQVGDYLGEDDIERYEDNYGRLPS